MPDQKSRSQRMVDRLREMRASSSDIEASAVVSTDGLIVASDLPAAAEEERLSAMSAAILSLGERISNELGRGRLNQVYIRGADGIFFVMPAGEEVVLTVLARREAKLGLVMLDSRRTAEDIAKIV